MIGVVVPSLLSTSMLASKLCPKGLEITSHLWYISRFSILDFADSECYNATSNGADYRGQVTITESGATCQPWGSNWPGMEELNYCRNPGHVGLRPWCFTNREENKWDYCVITECSGGECL